MDYLTGVFLAFKSLMKTFNVYDALDIIIVAFLIYGLIKLIRESRAGQFVKGIVIIFGYTKNSSISVHF